MFDRKVANIAVELPRNLSFAGLDINLSVTDRFSLARVLFSKMRNSDWLYDYLFSVVTNPSATRLAVVYLLKEYLDNLINQGRLSHDFDQLVVNRRGTTYMVSLKSSQSDVEPIEVSTNKGIVYALLKMFSAVKPYLQ